MNKIALSVKFALKNQSKLIPLSLVNFEVNCFSLLYPAAGISSGNLKYFHSFFTSLNLKYGKSADCSTLKLKRDLILNKTKNFNLKND